MKPGIKGQTRPEDPGETLCLGLSPAGVCITGPLLHAGRSSAAPLSTHGNP